MTKYDAHGTQAEFEPNSGGLVLRNLLGITSTDDMEAAESEALMNVRDWALLMAMQTGLPTLDFAPLSGQNLEAYILSIHAAFRGDYAPLEAKFLEVLAWSARRA